MNTFILVTIQGLAFVTAQDGKEDATDQNRQNVFHRAEEWNKGRIEP